VGGVAVGNVQSAFCRSNGGLGDCRYVGAPVIDDERIGVKRYCRLKQADATHCDDDISMIR